MIESEQKAAAVHPVNIPTTQDIRGVEPVLSAASSIAAPDASDTLAISHASVTPVAATHDREGLIRSFMLSIQSSDKAYQRAVIKALPDILRSFCDFCDKFKTERKSA